MLFQERGIRRVRGKSRAFVVLSRYTHCISLATLNVRLLLPSYASRRGRRCWMGLVSKARVSRGEFHRHAAAEPASE